MQGVRLPYLVSLVLVATALVPRPSYAIDSTREFINSCVYGTAAGTLVGLASLAFTSQPGDNLQNIARGASLGLYAGIALGIYAVNSENNPATPAGQQAPAHSQNSRKESAKEEARVLVTQMEMRESAHVQLFPGVVPVVNSERHVDGAQIALLLAF